MNKESNSVTLTIKTHIYPTKKQKEYFHKAFGIRRFVYNYGVDKFNKGLYTNNGDIQKEINHALVKDDNYSWLTEVNSMVRQEALKDLQFAVNKYKKNYKKNKENNTLHKDRPKFKSKKKSRNSFRMNNKTHPVVPISKHKFYLTTTRSLKGFIIKCKDNLLFLKKENIRFCTITITEECNKYYAYITYEKINYKLRYKKKRKHKRIVGIDMGIKRMLTCVDNKGKYYYYKELKNLRKQEKKTDKLQQKLSKKVYYSNNYKKTLLKLKKSYQKENNIKKDYREKLTKKLCKKYDIIKIEAITNKAHKSKLGTKINRAILRISVYTFMIRLQEKAALFNTEIIEISHKPTTQTCSNCGNILKGKDKLSLKDRIYKCKKCGMIMNRDKNAAINILNMEI